MSQDAVYRRARASLFVLIAATVFAVLVTGCASAGPGRPDGGPVAVAPKADAAVPEWVLSQAYDATGRTDLNLVRMDDASQWLGGAGIAGFRNRSDGTEFIADLTAKRLVAFTPAGGVDGPTAKEPDAYPGEPGREAILQEAEARAAKKAPGLATGGMRRTVIRRVEGAEDRGDVLEYQIRYQRYVGGVRVREFASVSVELPTWSWKPRFYVNTHPSKDASPSQPLVAMREAIQIASKAAGIPGSGVTSAELVHWGRGLEWLVILDRGAPAPGAFGGGGAAVNVDAITGEVRSTATSSGTSS